MQASDWIIIIVIAVALIIVGFYFLNKWAYNKMNTQQEMINKAKNLTNIYVIDKKRDKITNINMPKAVIDNMPKVYRFMKMNFVQAKIGPQIVTLICDKNIFKAIPTKKNIKVELAGIYIVSVIGMKTPQEMKAIQKAKRKEEKEKKKAEKNK